MSGIDIEHFVRALSVSALPLLFAITFHEAAHGYVAWKRGDPTAKMLGRVTLNPLPHIDPVGTVAVPLLLLLTKSPFLFGWARPVPVNFRLLRDSKRDPVLVAAAGVATNLALAAFSGVVFRLITALDPGVAAAAFGLEGTTAEGGAARAVLLPVGLMCIESIRWNVLLAVFNLIPVPPLDGGRIVVGLAPPRVAAVLGAAERYGMAIVVVLFMFDPFGIIRGIVNPLIYFLIGIFLGG